MDRAYEIRRAEAQDAEAIARVQVATWQVAYQAILPPALIERIGIEDRAKMWQQIFARFAESGQGGAYLVEQAGQAVGFASFGLQREDDLAAAGFDGELTALYVLPEHQRRGLGQALVQAAATGLIEAGQQAMALWVISANRAACDFYRALDGQVVAERADPQGGEMAETAYGWRDLATLTAQA